MSVKDYQPFGAFYLVTQTFQGEENDIRNGQPILYGSPRMHYIQCAPDVYYIRLAKDTDEQLLDVDLKGEFLCDFRLDSVDEQSLAITYLLTGSTAGMYQVTRQIVAMDEAQGLEREQVLNLRAGIMSTEFLGFIPAHVFLVRPELAGSDEIEVEGAIVSVPRFNGGSWWELDNPEFV